MVDDPRPAEFATTMKPHIAAESAQVFCDRCGTELRPGTGNFYVVKIEAVADPAPPTVTEPDPPISLGGRRGVADSENA
jgi:hypothetical protein